MIHKLANITDVKMAVWYEFSLQTSSALLSIMLIRNNNVFQAFENSCPHQGRRMDFSLGQFLTTEKGNIVCPAHAAEFNPQSGLCINGPCLGQSLKEVQIQLNEESIFAIIK